MRFDGKSATIFVAILLVIASLVAFLLATRPEPVSETRDIQPARVETVIVSATTLKPTRLFHGRVEPRFRSLLHFEVAGRVTEVHVAAGDRVSRGTVLVSIDDADYRDQLSEAELAFVQERRGIERDRALLELARENSALAQKEVDRLSRLGSKLASQSALDDAQQSMSQFRSEVLRLEHVIATAQQRQETSQLAVDKTRRNLERTTIRAPYDGIVSRRLVSPGDYAPVNSAAIQLITADLPELLIHVPTAVVPALSAGQQLRLLRDHADFRGEVRSIQPDADEKTGTHEVRIRITDATLVPGEILRAEVPLGELDDILTVPVSALLSEEGKEYLFIVSDSRLERRLVRTGVRVASEQQIIEGAVAGEAVVARDVAALVDGQRVVVAEE
jgi:RND family efflux transporter MFP subunit